MATRDADSRVDSQKMTGCFSQPAIPGAETPELRGKCTYRDAQPHRTHLAKT
jgi:hypothetical protein